MAKKVKSTAPSDAGGSGGNSWGSNLPLEEQPAPDYIFQMSDGTWFWHDNDEFLRGPYTTWPLAQEAINEYCAEL